MFSREEKGISDIFFEALGKISNSYFFMENENLLSRWSPAAVDDFELPGEYVQDVKGLWRNLIHPADLAMYDTEVNRIVSGQTDYYAMECRVRKRNGEYVKLSSHGNVIRNKEGKIQWFIGILKEKNDGLDPNTRIFNIYEAAKDIADTFHNENAKGALMYLGIDNFKRVNDLYTFSGGDEVLRKLAAKLLGIIPPSARLYRMEGDKFAVFFPYAGPDDMVNIYNRASEEASRIMLRQNVEVSVTLSAGVGLYPKDGETPELLQRNVQYAMDRAKRQGKAQITFFSQELLEQYLRKLRLIEALRKSVKSGFAGFELYYQPIVDTNTRKIVECEALLRWKSEEFTNATPADFIPILEETGMIIEVGEWVLREALAQVKRWGEPRLVVNVNVSYMQLKDEGFAEYALSVLREYLFEPDRLVVELTESCKVPDMSVLHSTIDKLRENDVNVALDDFGTGYASLGVLRDVQADWVKIDHQFVAKSKDNWVERNIVRHIIMLAHALDIKVCVEGIENEEVYQVAREENADTLQGYYFSRPVPACEFEKMLRENGSR